QQFADGGIERYDYELSGGLITSTVITDPAGFKTTKRFNANGYVVGMIDELGQSSIITRDLTTNDATARAGSCGCPEESSQFDERGNLLARTDRRGQTVRFEYEPVYNLPTKIVDEAGQVTLISYDAHGRLAT